MINRNNNLNMQMSNARCQKSNVPRSGQTMILTVMLLSTAVLGASSIVGLLMIYELRNTLDVVNSAKALAAADSGIQCALMKQKETEEFGTSERECGTRDVPIELEASGAKYFVEEITGEAGLPIGVRSVGTAGRTSRSFEASYGDDDE